MLPAWLQQEPRCRVPPLLTRARRPPCPRHPCRRPRAHQPVAAAHAHAVVRLWHLPAGARGAGAGAGLGRAGLPCWRSCGWLLYTPHAASCFCACVDLILHAQSALFCCCCCCPPSSRRSAPTRRRARAARRSRRWRRPRRCGVLLGPPSAALPLPPAACGRGARRCCRASAQQPHQSLPLGALGAPPLL